MKKGDKPSYIVTNDFFRYTPEVYATQRDRPIPDVSSVIVSSSHFGTYQNVFQYALSISNGSTDASKAWSTGSTP